MSGFPFFAPLCSLWLNNKITTENTEENLIENAKLDFNRFHVENK